MPGALRAALTAGRPPGFSRGMNEHETHPAKKLDTVALRAKVRAWLDAKAHELAVRPPAPAPRYDELFFRGTAWLDSLSYLDDWSGCGAAPGARLPDEEAELGARRRPAPGACPPETLPPNSRREKVREPAAKRPSRASQAEDAPRANESPVGTPAKRGRTE